MTVEVNNTVKDKGVWGFWATAGFGLALLVISFIVETIIAVIFIVAGIISDRTADFTELDYAKLMDYFINNIDLGLLISLSIIISAVVCTGILLLFIRTRRGVPIAEYIGLKSFNVRAMLISLGVFGAYFIALFFITSSLGSPADEDFLTESYAATISPVLFWLAIVVFGPVFEEILFRGFLFTGFRNSRIGVIGAVLLTSLLWAGSHLQYQLFGIASVFIMGLILGLVRHKTGSLWVPVIIHAFNNLLAMLLIAV